MTARDLRAQAGALLAGSGLRLPDPTGARSITPPRPAEARGEMSQHPTA